MQSILASGWNEEEEGEEEGANKYANGILIRWTAAIIWIKIQLKSKDFPVSTVHTQYGDYEWLLPSRHEWWPLYANKNSWDSLKNLSTRSDWEQRAYQLSTGRLILIMLADNLVSLIFTHSVPGAVHSLQSVIHLPLALFHCEGRAQWKQRPTIRWLAPMAIHSISRDD